MKINKKKNFIFILLLLVVLLVGSTYAVFYTQFAIPNKFDVMLYDVKVEDDFNGNWGVRSVKFTNNDVSNTSIVLRISYNEIWNSKINGSIITLNNYVDGKNVVNKEWTDEFLNDFVLADDGWYYYKKELLPQQSVQVLKSVNLNEELISNSVNYTKYKNFDYDLSFNYEAISSDADLIKDVWNKNVTIKEGEVNWDL